MRTFAPAIALTLSALGCNGSQSGPDACIAAGGQCVLGFAINMCASMGTPDCNPDHNPGGAFCCLAFVDAGGDAMGNAADASAPDSTLGDSSTPEAAALSDSGSTFVCGDASCSALSQFCYHVVGGVAPGVDNRSCKSLPPPASECAADGGRTGCRCTEDGGALYVLCLVP